MQVEEGRVQLKSRHRIWYRRIGSGDAIPLLTLHGGPGSGHDYLEPLEKLAVDRPVILYDQLGCGKSDQPDDRSLWRMERFLTELDEVREALTCKRFTSSASPRAVCLLLNTCSPNRRAWPA
ncbi:MAG: alpha/beta fold hydrolase [Verrucomicrobia bacterium]|nr:alpha/beta fold hydrolase [Verrucomicrobiota bacterium]